MINASCFNTVKEVFQYGNGFLLNQEVQGPHGMGSLSINFGVSQETRKVSSSVDPQKDPHAVGF